MMCNRRKERPGTGRALKPRWTIPPRRDEGKTPAHGQAGVLSCDRSVVGDARGRSVIATTRAPPRDPTEALTRVPTPEPGASPPPMPTTRAVTTRVTANRVAMSRPSQRSRIRPIATTPRRAPRRSPIASGRSIQRLRSAYSAPLPRDPPRDVFGAPSNAFSATFEGNRAPARAALRRALRASSL
jgi:hypothetical protein